MLPNERPSLFLSMKLNACTMSTCCAGRKRNWNDYIDEFNYGRGEAKLSENARDQAATGACNLVRAVDRILAAQAEQALAFHCSN